MLPSTGGRGRGEGLFRGVTCSGSGELEDAELMMDDSEVTEAEFEDFMAELAEFELNPPGPSSRL